MSAPLTCNSITERVVYTGIYVPDSSGAAEVDDAQRAPRETTTGDRVEGSQEA